MSDHSLIKMSINISNILKSTLWKFNLNILNNSQVKEKLEKEIEAYFRENNNGEVSPPMALTKLDCGEI